MGYEREIVHFLAHQLMYELKDRMRTVFRLLTTDLYRYIQDHYKS